LDTYYRRARVVPNTVTGINKRAHICCTVLIAAGQSSSDGIHKDRTEITTHPINRSQQALNTQLISKIYRLLKHIK